MLNHRVAVAALMQRTAARFQGADRFGDVVEEADPHALTVRPPHFKQFAQEMAVLRRRNGAWTRRAIVEEFGDRDEKCSARS